MRDKFKLVLVALVALEVGIGLEGKNIESLMPGCVSVSPSKPGLALLTCRSYGLKDVLVISFVVVVFVSFGLMSSPYLRIVVLFVDDNMVSVSPIKESVCAIKACNSLSSTVRSVVLSWD